MDEIDVVDLKTLRKKYLKKDFYRQIRTRCVGGF